MVNSRTDFEAKRKNEAFRRIRYLHPTVAGRTRFAREAWKEPAPTTNSAHHLEISLRSEPSQQQQQQQQQHQQHQPVAHNTRSSTRKGPLRSLFYNSSSLNYCLPPRPATDTELQHGSDIVVSNYSDVITDFKQFKTREKCLPDIKKSRKPRDHLEGLSEKRTEVRTSDSLCDHYEGWGRRKTKDLAKNVNFRPLIRTMDPISPPDHRNIKNDNLEHKQLPNVWVREQSIVRTTQKGSSVRNIKPLSKLDMKFDKSD